MKIRLILNRITIRGYLLISLAGGCLLLTFVRQAITLRSTFNFLIWNLFLAALPWLISMFASSRAVDKRSRILSILLFAAWFLFLPNAFYIITDLFYLVDHPEYFFWYDMIMILFFAWTGLLLGFFSLERIEDAFAGKLTKPKSVFITVLALFISAFGVYLGRDLHWNSWGVFIDPKNFFLDVFDRFIKPFGHGRTWSFTLLYGMFLNVIYWPLKLIQKKDQSLPAFK